MAEEKVEFNLTEYGLGKVNVPVKDFWTSQVLWLVYGDNPILRDYLQLSGSNPALEEVIERYWCEHQGNLSRKVILPQFEGKVCLRCPNNGGCSYIYESKSVKRVRAGRGESSGDFEKRVREGLCVNPKILEVKR
jgi:hypothetical protein